MRIPGTTWGRGLRLGKNLIIFDHSVLFVNLTEDRREGRVRGGGQIKIDQYGPLNSDLQAGIS